MTKKEFLTQFFSSLKKEKINYFIYGSYLALPEDTGGSDIDMVVAESDIKKVEAILEKLTKDFSVCRVSYYANANANAKFYRYLSSPPSFGIQLDVFYRGLCYQGIEYYPMQLMRERIIEYHGIKVLDINKGYYVDFIKEILHLGKAREKYLQAFIKEINTDKAYYRQELSQLYGSQFANLVFSHLSETQLPDVYKQLQSLIKEKILRGKHFKRWMVKAALLGRLFKKRPGYVIVVEGTDGSGKSFVIDHISPLLNEAFHNGVVYNHLRPNAIPDLGILLGKKKKQKEVTVCEDPHGQTQSGVIGSLVRWGYYMLDYTLGYLKIVWPQIHTKSKVFIFDRYYYDYYIDQKRSRTRLPHWMIRFGECFIPTPDLILCLGGDPKKIYERKPETSLEEVTRQTKALRDFCAKRKNAVWINTTHAPEESIKDTINAIYHMMYKFTEKSLSNKLK